MRPWVRKLLLTAHVTSSIGWFGAVAAFLALAVLGLRGADGQVVRSAYVAMGAVTWWVIVPLCLAAFLTGLVQSLGTSWGLFRHYWVLAKLLLTVMVTALLLLHTQPIGYLASAARETTLFPSDFAKLRIQLVADAGAALVVLLIATVLAVFKPPGMTRYGWRKQHQSRAGSKP